MRKSKRSAFVASVLCLVVSAGLVATATAANDAKTTVTIKAQGADMSGVIKSPKTKCMKDRKVTLYKQKGKNQNPKKDSKIGSDNASLQNGKYRWSTGNTGTYGKLYAVAKKTAGCKGARSKTVKVNAPI